MNVQGMSVAVAPIPAAADSNRQTARVESFGNGLKRLLFEERHEPSFGRWEAAILFLYSTVLAICVPRHESWFDEAQAWLIAKDSGLSELVLRRLHYEGAPALWHLILWAANRLGAPFAAMHVIAAVIAVAGAFVWLRFCPLPRLLTWLMPFTFFLQYQYAVVARSYVLAPLFAYLIMRQIQRGKKHALSLALLIGLFANCSLHMAAFACGLALIAAVRYIRRESWKQDVAQLMPATAVFLAFLLASAAVALPTSDGSSTSANPVVTAVRKTVSGDTISLGTETSPEQGYGKAGDVPPQKNKFGVLLFEAMSRQPQSGSGVFDKVAEPRVIRHVLVFLTSATATISTSNATAAGFLVLLAVCLYRSRLLITLAPWFLVQCCNVLVTGEAHHFGLLWVALTCSMWALALEPPRRPADGVLRGLFYSYLLAIVISQIGWSSHAVYSDTFGAYSGSREVAHYLASLPAGKRVAAFDDDAVTVNAYLDRRPYFNHQVDYWPFSRTRNPSLFEKQVIATRPDVVSVKMSSPDRPVMDQWVKLDIPGVEYSDPTLLSLLKSEGYHPTHKFCGHRFYRDAAEATDCRILFEPITQSIR